MLTNLLQSKSRPASCIKYAGVLFQKRIAFKYRAVDCSGAVSALGIAAASLGEIFSCSTGGTPPTVGLLPTCPVTANYVAEPCLWN